MGHVTSNIASVISMAPAVATPAPAVTSPSLIPSVTATTLAGVKRETTTGAQGSAATTITPGAGQLVVTGTGLGGANLATVAATGFNPAIITPTQLTQG